MPFILTPFCHKHKPFESAMFSDGLLGFGFVPFHGCYRMDLFYPIGNINLWKATIFLSRKLLNETKFRFMNVSDFDIV